MRNKLELLTWIAGLLIIISYSDLVYNVYKTKNTSSLTYSWIYLVISSHILYSIFGLINNIKGIFIPYTMIILMISYVYYVKLTNK
jgi:uncharacterized protein with PQ loop repeat